MSYRSRKLQPEPTGANLLRLAGDVDADGLNEPLLGRERSAPHRDTSCSAAGTSSAGTQQGGGGRERGKGASVALVLRSVNRIDWAELWSVLCSSVWGASHTLPVKAVLVSKPQWQECWRCSACPLPVQHAFP